VSQQRKHYIARYNVPGLQERLQNQVSGLEAQLSEFIFGDDLARVRKDNFIEAQRFAKTILRHEDGIAFQNFVLDTYRGHLELLLDATRQHYLDEYRKNGRKDGY
jgi:hypothetical protein